MARASNKSKRGGSGQESRVVLFSGGTACRAINLALSRRGYRLTRIVPAWDSGGSSKVLREAFGMMPIGDVRQALMTMAHGEGKQDAVVKVYNARLSGDLSLAELVAELDYYVSGRHPLIGRMQPEIRDATLGFLRLFRERAGPSLDLRNGSIGNFVLTGAYLANGCDISRAIGVFRELCDIDGCVWPASPLADIELRGALNDGRLIQQQHLLGNLSDADSGVGVASVELCRADMRSQPQADEMVVAAIREADAIIFGPGSFWTSIYPHLLVGGVLDAVAANCSAPRIFIGNILECAETRGVTLGVMLERIVRKMADGGATLTHILSNRELFAKRRSAGGMRQGWHYQRCR
jgi:2-phospho-L-lactate transferase/gluconeogenesis factor (CofD/UPF0052 family)